MGTHARRRRASGSLGALKRYLWVTISYNLTDSIEFRGKAHSPSRFP
jgi:hypothetical protein